MNGRVRTPALTLLICASLLIACGNAETSEPNVVVAQTFFDVPICNRLRTAIVYYVVDTDEFFFCDGQELQAVDLSGQNGEDGQDGQDGTSCTVTNDGAGTTTISCEDGTTATVSDGQDGQDGTSCTVSRDDAAGTTTISCEDGTVAVVEDGEDGQDGGDGSSCTLAETAAGATITCGTDTVTITDGQDGSSCTASTDATGAVTISCDDGTSATIPAGDDDVALLCGLLVSNPSLVSPEGLECPPLCGNGVLDPEEDCDPPNGVTCDASCQRIPTCGDGIVDTALGEQCDPPDGVSCNGSCQAEACNPNRGAGRLRDRRCGAVPAIVPKRGNQHDPGNHRGHAHRSDLDYGSAERRNAS